MSPISRRHAERFTSSHMSPSFVGDLADPRILPGLSETGGYRDFIEELVAGMNDGGSGAGAGAGAGSGHKRRRDE